MSNTTLYYTLVLLSPFLIVGSCLLAAILRNLWDERHRNHRH